MILFNKSLIIDGEFIEGSKILVFDTLYASVPISDKQTVYKSIEDLKNKINGISLLIPSEVCNSFGVVEATKGILQII